MIKFDNASISLEASTFFIKLDIKDNQLYINKIGNKANNHIFTNNPPENLILSLPHMMFSYFGECDYREALLYIKDKDGSFSDHYHLDSYRIVKDVESDWPLPKNINEYLEISYINELKTIKVQQYLSLDSENNTLISFYKVTNFGDDIFINRIMSLQIDYDDDEYNFYTFNGKWGDERNIAIHHEEVGTFINDSKSGASSAQNHPSFILFKDDNYYLYNLIYSGNHKSIIHNSHLHNTRVLVGANDFMMDINLKKGESFTSPCATLTYGCCLNEVSQYSHNFINNHIRYNDATFPLVFNSWEAEEFNLNKNNWPALAKKAKEIGVDTFVFDDGWFGVNRNDTEHDIGDWVWNEEKMGSIPFVKKTLNDIGLKFGLWIEPEVICPNSRVWDKMKKYSLVKENEKSILLRGTYALDYSNQELIDLMYEKLEKVLKEYQPDYVKWDYNRSVTDLYLTNKNYGTFYLDYIKGYYQLIRRLREKFPNIIFEGCSSGGNRFDDGTLYYFGSIWTSDCTDAKKRIRIQENTALVFPLKSMTNHISEIPNQQTKLKSSIHDRINVALFGQMGVEQNLSKTPIGELNNIKEGFNFYNKYKNLILNGDYYFTDIFSPIHSWTIVAKDKKIAIALLIKLENRSDKIKLNGLISDKHYRVSSRHQNNALDINIPLISGKALMEEGIDVSDSFLELDKENNEINISTRVVVIEEI